MLEDLLDETHEYLNRKESLIADEERFDCEAVVSLLVAVVISGDVHLRNQSEFIRSMDTRKVGNKEWLKLLWPSTAAERRRVLNSAAATIVKESMDIGAVRRRSDAEDSGADDGTKGKAVSAPDDKGGEGSGSSAVAASTSGVAVGDVATVGEAKTPIDPATAAAITVYVSSFCG